MLLKCTPQLRAVYNPKHIITSRKHEAFISFQKSGGARYQHLTQKVPAPLTSRHHKRVSNVETFSPFISFRLKSMAQSVVTPGAKRLFWTDPIEIFLRTI